MQKSEKEAVLGMHLTVRACFRIVGFTSFCDGQNVVFVGEICSGGGLIIAEESRVLDGNGFQYDVRRRRTVFQDLVFLQHLPFDFRESLDPVGNQKIVHGVEVVVLTVGFSEFTHVLEGKAHAGFGFLDHDVFVGDHPPAGVRVDNVGGMVHGRVCVLIVRAIDKARESGDRRVSCR